ncbi:hypothetical protein DPMN_038786 [Dreissena polymorpha]|uniref:Fibronectin type-III domain-containing protein n=1 Tax=Dreissena polymorpha TaxID=45954 RepID=A0A9D4RQN4_DREPO|nr:hypothetical protein DPMN_038786 [Dreissena polymorpha]
MNLYTERLVGVKPLIQVLLFYCYPSVIVTFKYFSNNPSALLDGLLPFRLYQISVRADLQGLQGPFSPPILVQTSEAGKQ